MIKKIGDIDEYGYDEFDRPVAYKAGPNTYVFGYSICSRFKDAQNNGWSSRVILTKEGGASAAFFKKETGQIEVWSGKWIQSDNGFYEIVNPSCNGVLLRKFNSFDEAEISLRAGKPIAAARGYLDADRSISSLVTGQSVADGALFARLQCGTDRYSAYKVREDVRSELGDDLSESIEDSIRYLFECVYRIRAASELVQYVDDLHFSTPQSAGGDSNRFTMLIEWKMIAGRESALSIYHFSKAREFLSGRVAKDSQILREKIDNEKMREATKLYRKYFPHARDLRNTVAHIVEFFSDPEEKKKHRARDDVFIESLMMNDVFQMPNNGRMVSVEVSSRTVEQLESIRSLIIEAYQLVVTKR